MLGLDNAASYFLSKITTIPLIGFGVSCFVFAQHDGGGLASCVVLIIFKAFTRYTTTQM